MARAQVVVVNLLPTAVLVLGALAAWRFLGAVRDALLILALAMLLAAGLHPLVSWGHRRAGVPRAVGAGIAVVALLGTLSAAGWLIAPPLTEQASAFARDLPTDLSSLERRLEPWSDRYPLLEPLLERDALMDLGREVARNANRLLAEALSLTLALLKALASLVFVVILTVYMLARPEPLVRGLLGAVPPASRARAERVVVRVREELAVWARSTLILMAAVGALIGLGLWLVGVENALLYGVLGGLGELVPTVGPVLAAVPPLLATLADDPGKVVWVLAVTVVAQQVEGNLLTPLILGRSVHLHPVSVLGGVLLLASVFGLAGAFLTVPVLIVVKALYEIFYLERQAGVPEREAREVLGEEPRA